LPIAKILDANRFDEIRQTVNSTAINRKMPEYFSLILLVFIVVPNTLDLDTCPNLAAKVTLFLKNRRDFI